MRVPADTMEDTATGNPDTDAGLGSRSRWAVPAWVLAGFAALALLAAPLSSSAQRCETVIGAAADSARQARREQNAFRDTVRRILIEAGAFDSRGIVLAFESPGDTVADITYERLDPPERTGRRIRAVVERGTGVPWIDALLRPLGRAMQFEPATIDGAPYGVWTRQRLAFELGG